MPLRLFAALVLSSVALAAAAHADEVVVVLDRGRVIAQGGHAELVDTCELYADMCARLQFGQVA